VAFPVYVDAGLIHMHKIRRGELSLCPEFETIQLLVGLFVEVEDRSGTDRNTHLLLKVVSNSIIWQ
jgi:hypothetical protein